MATFDAGGMDIGKFAEQGEQLVDKVMEKGVNIANVLLNPKEVQWNGGDGEPITTYDSNALGRYKFRWEKEKEVRIQSAIVVYKKFGLTVTKAQAKEKRQKRDTRGTIPLPQTEAEATNHVKLYEELRLKRFKETPEYKKAEKKCLDWEKKGSIKTAKMKLDGKTPRTYLDDLEDVYKNKIAAKVQVLKTASHPGGVTAGLVQKIADQQTAYIKSKGGIAFTAPYEVVYEVAKVDDDDADSRIATIKAKILSDYGKAIRELKDSLKPSTDDAEKAAKFAQADLAEAQRALVEVETQIREQQRRLTELQVAEKTASAKTLKETRQKIVDELNGQRTEEKEARAAVEKAEAELRRAKKADSENLKRALSEARGLLAKVEGHTSAGVNSLKDAQAAEKEVDELFKKEGQDDFKDAISQLKAHTTARDKALETVDKEAAKVASLVKDLKIIRNFRINHLPIFGKFREVTSIGTDASVDAAVQKVSDEEIRLYFKGFSNTDAGSVIKDLHWSTRTGGAVIFRADGSSQGDATEIGTFFNNHAVRVK